MIDPEQQSLRNRYLRHQIPTHLSVPDTIFSVYGVGITVRQLLVLMVGWSVVVNVWIHCSGLLMLGLFGSVLRLALCAMCVLLDLVVAFKQVEGRPLETWLLVLLRYWQAPKVYLWRSVRQEGATEHGAGEPEREHAARKAAEQDERFW
jgi:hypothetical protein